MKKDFPIFSQPINGKKFIYLDNAATTHKPQSVIDAVAEFYTHRYATVHRSMYYLAEHATHDVEIVRAQIAGYINAQPQEIIFTKGTTEGINAIAATWADSHITEGDEIVLTELEHHSNLLPWQLVAKKKNAILKFIPITAQGTLDYAQLPHIITERTKLVAIVHVSNAIGTHNNIALIAQHAKKIGARILVDAAQSVAHQIIDVQELQCDFLTFSAHKMFGPTGLGILYIKQSVQPEVPPYQVGGGMVFSADYHQATWLQPPASYEAGTLPIAGIIGFGAALNYIKKYIDFKKLSVHEAALCTQTIETLQKVPNVRILGPIQELKKAGHLVSFVVDTYHPHDIGAYLDTHGVAVRTGHYCAQPLAQKLGIHGSIRLSFSCYNTADELDFALSTLTKFLKSH